MGMRFGRILAVIALVAFLAGCSLPGVSPKAKEQAVGICLPPVSESWSGCLMAVAKEAAQGWEGRVEVVPTPEIPGSLEDAARELIALKVGVAVMYAFDPVEGARAAALLDDAGIALILVGNGIEGDRYGALVTEDDEGIGRAAAEDIALRLGGQGDVLVLEGIPGIATTLRTKGFTEGMAQHPGIVVVGATNCGGLRSVAKSEMQLAYEDNPNINGVFAHNDEMALGAIDALEEVYAQTQAVVGVGGSKEAIEMLMKNHRYLRMTFAYPPTIAADAVKLAVGYLAGEPLPEDKRVLLPADPINPTNALEKYDENALY